MAVIYYGIPSESLVKKNIERWINKSGEPDVFVEKDENLDKYKSKLLDKYDVISFKEAMDRFPNADVWVTWRRVGITKKMLIAALPPNKIHFLEDMDSEAELRMMEEDSINKQILQATSSDGTAASAEIANITQEFLSMIKLPDEKCKKLNYLLVMPISESVNRFEFIFHVGIAYISSALKASGRQLFILNLDHVNTGNPYVLLKQEIIRNKIDVIMTGGVSVYFWNIKKIIDAAKEVSPNIKTIVGGIVITSDPAAAMEAFQNADYGIIGEGEITVNSLAYALETNDYMPDINGIVFRKNDEWVVREKYPSVPDLRILPYPDYEGFGYSRYIEKAAGHHKRAFINSSRSCMHRCTFCFNKHGKYRRLSMDDTFKLIDWMLQSYPGIKRLHLGDELSFSTPEYAIEFSRRIKPYKLSWRCSTRVDKRINEEMLIALKNSGCNRILIGIESADNNVLKSMRKGINIEQVEKAIAMANKVGAQMDGNLIFGDLAEDMDSVVHSLNWFIKHRKNVKEMFMIRIHPGSHLYEVACEKNLIKNRADYIKSYMLPGAVPVNLSKLSQSEFSALSFLLKFMNRLQLEGESGFLALPILLKIMNKLQLSSDE